MKKRIISITMIWIIALSLWLFIVPAMANERTINFEWEPCPEADIQGYRLYQSADSGGYTFGAGYEAVEVDSTVNGCSVTIMEEGPLYWVLTAFDTQLNESGPSNEVTWIVDFTKPGAPILRFAGWR